MPGICVEVAVMLPVPLVVEFPFPAWATRPEERAPDPADADLLLVWSGATWFSFFYNTAAGQWQRVGDPANRDTFVLRAGTPVFVQRRTAGAMVYDPTTDSTSAQTLSLLSELRQAIDNGELRLFLQPKIAIATGAVCGAEATPAELVATTVKVKTSAVTWPGGRTREPDSVSPTRRRRSVAASL